MLPVESVVKPGEHDPGAPRTSPTNAAEPDSPTVVKLLEQYLAALESGSPLSRRALLAGHPELIHQLSPRLDALDFIFNVAPQLADHDANDIATFTADQQSKCLGDFRLLREIGRGGMGVVYEADQISLGRRVALKVLPFAAMLSVTRLRRFQNEARIAASLDHPHIVAIHAVGVERGVHYYAMQLIHGQSGDRFIAELRSHCHSSHDHLDTRLRGSAAGALPLRKQCRPVEVLTESVAAAEDRSADCSSDHEMTFDSPPQAKCSATTVADHLGLSTEKDVHTAHFFQLMARLGSQAAEALQFAHDNGVLHRDIKPANLLLGIDGHLWVTDFGLAHLQAETGMTLTGELIGTLRYMSPEQAQGDRHVVDPRSDVYSLGATLYELLTLRPIFTSQDRPTVLKQIAEQEPRRLRSIDPCIPRDLETIVVKALQKRPEDRYVSAQALADDLQRFLEQKPIQAKPPSALTYTRRWSRRYARSLSAVAAALTLTLAVVAALITGAYRREAQQRLLAEWQQARAETNLQFAKSAVDTMYTRFAQEWLANDWALTNVQREFLERAAEFYDRLGKQEASDPAIQFDIATAKTRLGAIYTAIGGGERERLAERQLEEARLLLEPLVQSFPENRDYQLALARCHLGLSQTLKERFLTGLPLGERRIQHLKTSQRLLDALLAGNQNDGEVRQLLHRGLIDEAAVHLWEGRHVQARQRCVDSLRVAEQLTDERQREILTAESIFELCSMGFNPCGENEDLSDTTTHLIATARARLEDNPVDVRAQALLARAQHGLAIIKWNREGLTSKRAANEVIGMFQESAQSLLRVVKHFPKRDPFLPLLVETSHFLLSTGGVHDDPTVWQHAIAVQEQILTSLPDAYWNVRTRNLRVADPGPIRWIPSVIDNLAGSYADLACLLAKNGQMDEALEVVEKFQVLMAQRDKCVSRDRWGSRWICGANGKLCEMFVAQQRPVDAYRHLFEVARHTHHLLQTELPKGRDTTTNQADDYALSCAEMLMSTYVRTSEAWGSASVVDACQDALTDNKCRVEELWLVQAMADAVMGNHAPVLDRMGPMINQPDPVPAETLLAMFSGLAWRLHDSESQQAVCQLVEKLLELREARDGLERWRIHYLGGTTHGELAQTYQEIGDWPQVVKHGSLAVELYERALREGLLQTTTNRDLRHQIGRVQLMCANAFFQQRDFNESAQAAAQATARFREYLETLRTSNYTDDVDGQRTIPRLLYRQCEADYFAGHRRQARKACEESLLAMREVIAKQTATPELEDQRMLCGLLTRSPFALPDATTEAQHVSRRLLDAAPDDPTVWYEAAWVDYRTGNAEAARGGFRRYLEATQSTTPPRPSFNSQPKKSCLDAMKETPEQRQRLALLGCALAQQSLGNADAAQECFQKAVEQFEAAREHTVFSLQEHCTLIEVAQLLQQADVVGRIVTIEPTRDPAGEHELEPTQESLSNPLDSAHERAESIRAHLRGNPTDSMSWLDLAGELNNLAVTKANSNGSRDEILGLFEDAAQAALNGFQHAPKLSRSVFKYWLTKTCLDLHTTADRSQDESIWRRVISTQEQVLSALPVDWQHLPLVPDSLGNRYPAVSETLAASYQGLACYLADKGRVDEAVEVVGRFDELVRRRDALVPKDDWPSWYVGLAHTRLSEMFSKQQRPIEAYRNLFATARHAHRYLERASRKGADTTRHHPGELLEMTRMGCAAASTAWGPESILQACRDAVARQEYEPAELVLVQLLANAELGIHDSELERLSPLLDQLDAPSLEAATSTLVDMAIKLCDHDNQGALSPFVQKILALRQSRTGTDAWESFFLGGGTHSILAQKYQELQDWPHVIQHGRLAAQHYARGLTQQVAEWFHFRNLRNEIGRAELMCANAYFKQRDYDQSAQAASRSAAHFREYLLIRPQDQNGQRKFARVLYRESEADYFVGRTQDARRVYDESLQAVRDLIAQQITPAFGDQRMLCGMLMRSPFSPPEATAEARHMSRQLLEAAPNDPTAWHEVAWVDYREGKLEAAHVGFERFLESLHSTAELSPSQKAGSNSGEEKSVLDAMQETDAQRQRIALLGCVLAEQSLGNADAAQDYFRQAVQQFEAAGEGTAFSMQEHCTLFEAARMLHEETVAEQLFRDQQ